MIALDATNIASAAVIFVFILVIVYLRFRGRKLNQAHFNRHWKRLERQCRDKSIWCKTIIEADELLNQALKKCHYKGKNTGERLVAAQRQLSSNHTVWFGHKLRRKIEEKQLTKISKKDATLAMSGFHKALIDLGALSLKPKTRGAK